jgi:hypothetical protein
VLIKSQVELSLDFRSRNGINNTPVKSLWNGPALSPAITGDAGLCKIPDKGIFNTYVTTYSTESKLHVRVQVGMSECESACQSASLHVRVQVCMSECEFACQSASLHVYWAARCSGSAI